MIQNIVKNWSFARLLRLAMGVFLVVEAVKSGMWLLVVVGAVFVAMPLFNLGCYASGNCSIPNKNSVQTNDEVEYEEIKIKQNE
ncbi:MAG: hypothetical protein AB7E26_08645 [Chryseobacterium sp.]